MGQGSREWGGCPRSRVRDRGKYEPAPARVILSAASFSGSPRSGVSGAKDLLYLPCSRIVGGVWPRSGLSPFAGILGAPCLDSETWESTNLTQPLRKHQQGATSRYVACDPPRSNCRFLRSLRSVGMTAFFHFSCSCSSGAWPPYAFPRSRVPHPSSARVGKHDS